MAEHYEIAGPARGVPQHAGATGARVRIPLDGAPGPRWSRAFAAHLATGLTGHPAVGHLKLDAAVQGTEVVLDGVEEPEAPLLGPVLREAIAAANRVSERAGDDEPSPPLNMAPATAAAVASQVTSEAERP